jgi:hypothetical protein
VKFHNFVTSLDDLENEKQARQEDEAKRIDLGIPLLDAVWGGAYPSDLILLGARSGAGKTEAATIIAECAVQSGKRVAFFALEAEVREITWRRVYRRLANAFFLDPKRMRVEGGISYHDWRHTKLEDVFRPYYQDVIESIRQSDQDRFWLRYRANGNFAIDDFEKSMASLKGFDLILVDHFHYFDLDGNELEQQRRLIKQIRDLVGEYRIPIVLIAHLRKGDKRFMTPIPDVEEFQGSSDLYKNPTKIALASPGPRFMSPSGEVKNQWVTYFNIAKCRTDGSRTKYQAKCVFDIETTSYLPKFRLGSWTDGAWKDLEYSLVPQWAKPFMSDESSSLVIPLRQNSPPKRYYPED